MPTIFSTLRNRVYQDDFGNQIYWTWYQFQAYLHFIGDWGYASYPESDLLS